MTEQRVLENMSHAATQQAIDEMHHAVRVYDTLERRYEWLREACWHASAEDRLGYEQRLAETRGEIRAWSQARESLRAIVRTLEVLEVAVKTL